MIEPLSNGGRSLHLQFHQLKLGVLQLFLGGNEVAGVRPKGGTIHRNDGSSGRTVKAADKFTTLPVVGHILTLMGVGTGEDKRSKVLSLHHLAEVL